MPYMVVGIMTSVKYIMEPEHNIRIPAPVEAMLFEFLVEPENTSVAPITSIAVQSLDSTVIPK